MHFISNSLESGGTSYPALAASLPWSGVPPAQELPGRGSGARLLCAASQTGSGSRSCDPKAGIYTPCSEIGKKDPFLLLDIFSNDLKESAKLNELVHLPALEAAATAQTGGGRGWRGRGEGGGAGAVGEKGSGRPGEKRGREGGEGGEEAKRRRLKRPAWPGCCALSSWLSGQRAAWDRFPGTVEGQPGVGWGLAVGAAVVRVYR